MSLSGRLNVGELPLQRLDVQFALTQHIGGLWNIDERLWRGQRAAGTKRDEEMRVVRPAATTIDAGFGRPEADYRMKCERFHSILQQQSNVRESPFQFPHKLLSFKLMLVELIGAASGASRGIVALI